MKIHRVLNSFPGTLESNDIYFVKTDKGIILGIAPREVSPTTPVVFSKQPTISGPVSLFHGETGTFTITNYGTDQSYSITSSFATIVQSGSTFTLTCSNTSMSSVDFTVNGKVFTVTLKAVAPVAATIVSPIQGSNVSLTGLQLASSAFAMNYPASGDTHLNSDWEISTDSNFTNIVASSYASTTNKTTFTP